jgi:hypothetical protein
MVHGVQNFKRPQPDMYKGGAADAFQNQVFTSAMGGGEQLHNSTDSPQ